MKTISLLFFISIFINNVFGDEVKSVSVMEGDSLTLYTHLTDTQADDVTIVWTFGPQKSTIAKINSEPKGNKISIYDDVLDGRFRDRLQVNDQTGDIIITNITTNHTGVYEIQITVRSKIIQKRFNVNGVINPESDQLNSVSVKDADSVTLHTDVPDIKKYDVIQWKFKGIRIAHFNKSASEISEDDDIHDQRFRDKLQLDVQTGSLKIKNIRMDLSGLYEVDLTSSSSGYTIHQSFTVTVSGEVKSVSVMKGDPVTINIDVPDIKTYDRILLVFGCDDKRIADVNKQNKQFILDKRFKERLALNDQTGDLTITDIRNEDTGLYELKMSSSRRSIQRRFSVSVSEQGLSPGAIAGISVLFILLAAAAAAAVIYYRRKITEAKQQLDEIQPLKVYEGKSADLKTEVTDIQTVDLIEWRFRETLIAQINPAKNIFSTYDGDDGLFTNKLELNPQTGDLTIKDISEEHDGVYTLKILRDGKTSLKRFNVFVRDEIKTLEVYEGEFVNLKTEVTDIQKIEKIEWRFEETLIAEINTANKSPTTCNDGLFRDKLKLNTQTGDLNINNIRQKHTGVYKLKIIRDGKTSYRRFTVFVRDKIKPLQVYEAESVDLMAEVKDIKRDDVIEWRFKETLIAEINPVNNIFRTYDGDDDLFRDKLKLNHQTGDLNIKDIRQKHEGDYTLKIIRGGKTSYKRSIVIVRDEIKPLQVDEWESVDLETEVKDIKRVEKIEWTFNETLIAEINPANNIFNTYDGDDDLFKDKLKLNHQTGDLNIKDIREKHTGVYKLKIIRDGEISFKRFSVFVRAYAGKMEKVSVSEGESYTLKNNLTEIKRDDVIEWTFGDDKALIAEINPANKIFMTFDGDDGLFRDKLKLNPQTGDLNINNISEEHTGVYKVKIIRGKETSYRRFNVSVRGQIKMLQVYEGESVDLETEVKDIKRDDVIEWRFGETLIAEINPVNNIFSTYNGDDELFRNKLDLNPQTGDLTINDIRVKHKGFYKLKIIRNGKTSDRTFNVFVRDDIKPLQVYEGESVDLKTELKDIKRVDLIEWRFGESLIDELNPAKKLFTASCRVKNLFRGKLKMNHQTGDLSIKNISEEDDGVYKLKIIRGGKTSYKTFRVSVRSSKKGDSVTVEMDPLLNNKSQQH